LRITLGRHHQVHTASSGEDALRIAPELRPDLILLDINMPGLDGISTCSRLREMPELAHTRVVMLTADDNEEARMRSHVAGSHDFLSKSMYPTTLEFFVDMFLDARKAPVSSHADSNATP
jgi:DNA-binding response OmpR family regulator